MEGGEVDIELFGDIAWKKAEFGVGGFDGRSNENDVGDPFGVEQCEASEHGEDGFGGSGGALEEEDFCFFMEHEVEGLFLFLCPGKGFDFKFKLHFVSLEDIG